MSGFLYFVPRPKSDLVRDGRLIGDVLSAADVDLSRVLADVAAVPNECVVAEVRSGPDGRPGTILIPVPVHRQLPGKLAYDADSQVWMPRAPGASALPLTHIGWCRDDVPRPPDLERSQQIPGWEIRDAYGDAWSIPVARSPTNRRGNFPFAVHWDDAGKPYCGVSGRYQDFWQDSARLWDLVTAHAQPARQGLAILGEGFSDEDDAFVLDMVHRALQINYRVDRWALAAYDRVRPGWLTQVTASLIANAIVDMQAKRAWEEAQKKTATPSAAAGVSSTPGEAAD